jgi:hypothetical protein
MSRPMHRLTVAAALLCCSAFAGPAEQSSGQEAQTNVFQVVPVPGAPASGENRLLFVSPGDASDSMNSMRKRLADPAQRAQVRSEQRAAIVEQHPELEEALQIDRSTANKVLEVLTDQQMDRLADVYALAARDPFTGLQERADAENRWLDQLRALLGERGSNVIKTTPPQCLNVGR